jgi:hypothetical protein
MVTAGPLFTEEQGTVIGVGFLLVGLWAVGFLTWAVVRVTGWFLRPRARSAADQEAVDAGRATDGLAGTATVGFIVGFGILVALFAAVREWT